jgi:hypothetical protein
MFCATVIIQVNLRIILTSISGQSAGNVERSDIVLELNPERRDFGIFSHPKKSAPLFVRGPNPN